jgi:hypothetical protein
MLCDPWQFGRAKKNSFFFSAEKKTYLYPSSAIIMSVTKCICQSRDYRPENDEFGSFFASGPKDAFDFMRTYGRPGGFQPTMNHTGPVLLSDARGRLLAAIPFLHDEGADLTWVKTTHRTRSYFSSVDGAWFTYIVVICNDETERRHLLQGVYEPIAEATEGPIAADREKLTALLKVCLVTLVSSATLSEAFQTIYNIMTANGVVGAHPFVQPLSLADAPLAAEAQPVKSSQKRERDEEEVDTAPEPQAAEKRQCTDEISSVVAVSPFNKSDHPIFDQLEFDTTVFCDSFLVCNTPFNTNEHPIFADPEVDFFENLSNSNTVWGALFV